VAYILGEGILLRRFNKSKEDLTQFMSDLSLNLNKNCALYQQAVQLAFQTIEFVNLISATSAQWEQAEHDLKQDLVAGFFFQWGRLNLFWQLVKGNTSRPVVK